MNIIFVCTGNTCRSPMAEYYLKSKNLEGVNVISRGFSGGEGANPKSVAVMKEVGIDISAHISRCISAEEIKNADAVICMTESHKAMLMAFASEQKQIFVLGGGIPDPFGCDIETYRKCRDSIFGAIDALIENGFFGNITVSVATKNDIPDIANIEKQFFCALERKRNSRINGFLYRFLHGKCSKKGCRLYGRFKNCRRGLCNKHSRLARIPPKGCR